MSDNFWRDIIVYDPDEDGDLLLEFAADHKPAIFYLNRKEAKKLKKLLKKALK
jgi:hypothetical protein